MMISNNIGIAVRTIIEELLKIKNAIESSEKVPKPLTSETVKPI